MKVYLVTNSQGKVHGLYKKESKALKQQKLADINAEFSGSRCLFSIKKLKVK